MPRKPKPANLDNPIRILRQQLGISQNRLAEILGTNGDAIRNLENGRMKIIAETFHQIIDRIGAEYRSRSKRWFVVLSDLPCDWNTFRVWRQSSRPSFDLKLRDHQALSYKIAALLGHAKPEEYNLVFGKISRLLEGCLEQHPNKEVEKAFKRSRPETHIISRSKPPEQKDCLSKEKIRQLLAAQPKERKKEPSEWSEEEIYDMLADADAEYSKLNPEDWRPLSNQEIREVTRRYEDLPDAAELLRGNEQGGNARAEPSREKHTKKRVRPPA